jgi:hypothetical protein
MIDIRLERDSILSDAGRRQAGHATACGMEVTDGNNYD